jgi:hypothetical protein
MNTQNADAVVLICSGCLLSTFSSILGVPQLDLLAGFAGSFMSLAFTKPKHWGDWINYENPGDIKIESLLWIRRTILIAFILTANALVMSALAQNLPVGAHSFAFMDAIHTETLSFIMSAFGQKLLPRLLGVSDKAERAP